MNFLGVLVDNGCAFQRPVLRTLAASSAERIDGSEDAEDFDYLYAPKPPPQLCPRRLPDAEYTEKGFQSADAAAAYSKWFVFAAPPATLDVPQTWAFFKKDGNYENPDLDRPGDLLLNSKETASWVDDFCKQIDRIDPPLHLPVRNNANTHEFLFELTDAIARPSNYGGSLAAVATAVVRRYPTLTGLRRWQDAIMELPCAHRRLEGVTEQLKVDVVRGLAHVLSVVRRPHEAPLWSGRRKNEHFEEYARRFWRCSSFYGAACGAPVDMIDIECAILQPRFARALIEVLRADIEARADDIARHAYENVSLRAALIDVECDLQSHDACGAELRKLVLPLLRKVRQERGAYTRALAKLRQVRSKQHPPDRAARHSQHNGNGSSGSSGGWQLQQRQQPE
ncbi:MAG: hypothetical protein H6835_19690 [Planctomycetes bacterium]|nr:hypothetical protein [Planctomycetota bacterium]